MDRNSPPRFMSNGISIIPITIQSISKNALCRACGQDCPPSRPNDSSDASRCFASPMGIKILQVPIGPGNRSSRSHRFRFRLRPGPRGDCSRGTHSPWHLFCLKEMRKHRADGPPSEKNPIRARFAAMEKTPFAGNIENASTTYFDYEPSGGIRKSKPAATRFRGLCSTCNRSSECSYIAGHDRPILRCEEFDGSRLLNPGCPAPKSPEGSGDLHSALMGLCCNCAHVDICRFPKPEGGIWHCEEYE